MNQVFSDGLSSLKAHKDFWRLRLRPSTSSQPRENPLLPSLLSEFYPEAKREDNARLSFIKEIVAYELSRAVQIKL